MSGIRLLIMAGLATSCSSLKTGPTKTHAIHVPAQPQAQRLQLSMPLGQALTLEPGGTETVTGTITTNLAELTPEIHTQGDRTTIRQQLPPHGHPPDDTVNRWHLSLGPTPLYLSLDTGVVEGQLQLGGLRLLGLQLEAGVQAPEIRFDRPNLTHMTDLRVVGGVGELKLSGLSHANTRKLTVDGGVGPALLDFAGSLRQSVDGRVTSGVGEVSLTFPANVPARLTLTKGVGEVRVSGFDRAGPTYQTPHFDPQQAHWNLAIDVGVGAIQVKREE